MKILSLATFVLLGVAAGGCVLDGDKNEPRISNQSGTAATVYWVGSTGDEVRFETIEAGQVTGLHSYPHACARWNMVAKTADGKELARTEKPLCPGDSWVIPPPSN